MTRQYFRIAMALAIVFFAATGQYAFALPTQVVHQDVSPHCDPLFIPTLVDEIGDPIAFPPDEQLLHADLGLFSTVCPPVDDPTLDNFLVSITNISGRDFDQVWYVADKETDISNYDGFANDIGFPLGHEAFRIDTIGVHRALVFESILADNIWQVGEEWRFVLQDYTNALGLPPDALYSPGIGDASLDLAGFVESSGSIIATPSVVPEPGTMLLAAMGLACLPGFSRRRRR